LLQILQLLAETCSVAFIAWSRRNWPEGQAVQVAEDVSLLFWNLPAWQMEQNVVRLMYSRPRGQRLQSFGASCSVTLVAWSRRNWPEGQALQVADGVVLLF